MLRGMADPSGKGPREQSLPRRYGWPGVFAVVGLALTVSGCTNHVAGAVLLAVALVWALSLLFESSLPKVSFERSEGIAIRVLPPERQGRNWRPHFRPKPPLSELGYLDYELKLEGVLERQRIFSTQLGEALMRADRAIVESLRTDRPIPRSDVKGQHRLAKKAAATIESHVKKLGRIEAKYRVSSEELATTYLGWIRTVPEPEGGWIVLDLAFWMTAARTRRQAETNRNWRESFRRMRDHNRSREANQALDRLVGVLDRLIEDTNGGLKYCAEAHVLILRRMNSAKRAAPQSPLQTTHDPQPPPPSQESGDKG